MTDSKWLLEWHDLLRWNRYKLVPYLISDGKKHPFAIICPGGAYSVVSSFVEGMPYAKALNEQGYHAIVLYYGVREKALFPGPQEDLKRAVREVFSHAEDWNLDTESWSLWGSSAGGHLIASYCLEKDTPKKPSALVMVYPVVTMGKRTHAVSRKRLLGKQPTEEAVDRMSVEKHITADFPPTFVWYGTADRSVDPENSRMLQESLHRAGIPHLVEEYEGIGHGVGLATGTAAEPWFSHAVAFWKAQ